MSDRSANASTSGGDLSLAQPPPHNLGGILRQLGPGLIIAGSIVGSGELIGTTKTGAEAGYTLLWLIVLGCLIKVFAQVEFGRYSLSTGHTAMQGMNEVPGPRWRANWLLWYWLVMFAVTVGQLGGIVGGVGQALAITLPINGDFRDELDRAQQLEQHRARFQRQLDARLRSAPPAERSPGPQRARIEAELRAALGPAPAVDFNRTKDDLYWSLIVTALTAALLVLGRYLLIQNVSTLLVAGFTLVTVGCVLAQQLQGEFALRWSDVVEGFRLGLPASLGSVSPLATALATFGIIGVGANEIIAYPYWCLEKGYARFVGARDDSPQWAERARGWMRVMRWDVWCSCVVYTFATLAFYMLGAGVLHPQGLNPSGNQMIRTLSEMYKPNFGAWTETVFLLGALAVLYSTFFVASAGHARAAADALRLFGLGAAGDQAWRRWVKILSGVVPCAAMAIFYWKKDPVNLVLLGGIAQAIMLPMLAGAALYFRYRRGDRRIAPGALWDVCLWLSFFGMLAAAGGICWTKGPELLANLAKLLGG